jgi:ElaB/YqjD/DUF883 family membrane-anchored ribosome-binding protein
MATGARRAQRNEATETMTETLQEAGATAKRLASEGYETIRDTASEYLDRGRERAREVGENIQDRVREQPIAALAVAAAAGFLLGVLLMRR